MPRRIRESTAGIVYHVLNRRVGRTRLFKDDEDYLLFEQVVRQAQERHSMRLLGYCLMPNHWHLVLWPDRDGQLSEFMHWLTLTHTQRWHARHRTAGQGSLYQGRFKSFPVEQDGHLLAVLRYVERNALRGGLVERAEAWRWSSLWCCTQNGRKVKHPEDRPLIAEWPLERPRNWIETVNHLDPDEEEKIKPLRSSVNGGRPFGTSGWVEATSRLLRLESTLRPRGRPKK